jgi:hypothetical protein
MNQTPPYRCMGSCPLCMGLNRQPFTRERPALPAECQARGEASFYRAGMMRRVRANHRRRPVWGCADPGKCNLVAGRLGSPRLRPPPYRCMGLIRQPSSSAAWSRRRSARSGEKSPSTGPV